MGFAYSSSESPKIGFLCIGNFFGLPMILIYSEKSLFLEVD
jgi:hypothetical protein